jgi:hydroxymethylglutaryl-CoA lyase
MPDRRPAVTVREVGLRDGLQSLSRTMPTAQKIEWLAREP